MKVRRATVCFVLVVLASAGCQVPLRLVIANTTGAPIDVSLRMAMRESGRCVEPARLAYMPASHVGRRFREPERSDARDVAFDPQLCSVRGMLPPGTALELEFSGLQGWRLSENHLDAELSVHGAAGSVVLEGPQILGQLRERSGALVLEYRSNAPPGEPTA